MLQSNTIRVLLLLVVCLSVIGAEKCTIAADGRPNVVLISVDDLGWTDLTCQGSQYFETPNIDQLADQGMRFTNAYAACAVCSPTRAAIMTGRYPARIGVTDWIRARFQGGKIPDDKKNPTKYVGSKHRKVLCPPNPLWMELEERTIAEVLQEAGYVTAHIGKWHLGADDWYPDRQGFDFNFGGCDFGQPPSYFSPYQIPTLESGPEGEYLTDREAVEAVNFVRSHKDSPFFLYWAPYAVHTPLQAKKNLRDKYAAKPKTNQKNATYAAMVQSVDEGVGQLLATLDELQLSAKTLVIFTSDNGGLMGPTNNAPLRSGKGYPYEGGIRVPTIVRWPGNVKAGTTSDEPIMSIDLYPTIIEATGVKAPPDRPIDGLSLVEHLKSSGKQGLSRENLFWHFPHYRHAPGPYSIIRSGDWKLIRWYEGERGLYNLASDLGEQTNLIATHADKGAELEKLLDEHLAAVGAKVPRANPDYTGPAPKRPRNRQKK